MYRPVAQALLIVIYFTFFNHNQSALSFSLSLAQVVQNLTAVKHQQIGICKKASQDTKLEMQSLFSESAAATTSTKKRASDSGLAFEALLAIGVYGGQVSSGLKSDAWNAEGEDFGGLGLGKWDYASEAALTEYARRPRLLFFNYIESASGTRPKV
jgi:hypothetical protein